MIPAWTTDEAIRLCVEIEAVCPAFGCHVALTGGTLYGVGARKDLDVVFYRVRQVAKVDVDGLFVALAKIGVLRETHREVWCIKATHAGRRIDCFFPEAPAGDYSKSSVEAPEPLTAEVVP